MQDIHTFLNEKYNTYNQKSFIATDPIQIPHQFSKKEDIEIAAFLVATIAWGQRKSIINNGNKLMQLMDDAPHEFILNFAPRDLKKFKDFVHRTFNYDDLICFLNALQSIYKNHGGLEPAIKKSFEEDVALPGMGWHNFKKLFFKNPHLPRTQKHLPDPMRGSAAKRMNMFLRWMIRKDNAGVDFGIWQSMHARDLYLPLDVHTSRVGRKLGLLSRKQNDWKSVLELTENLRKLDAEDPVKYDFALFGLGVFENF